jgi:glycosyltransferase involved in cell wall biosynthesis
VRVEPLVSVVVPVYNGERHLRGCLASILEQTYQNIQVVISDQASTDRSLAIIREFTDPRIVVLPPPRSARGLHSNWNRALAAAEGELVKIVCQDDLLLPECLAVQVGLLTKFPSAVMACGRRRIITDSDSVLLHDRGLAGIARLSPRIIDGRTLARACTKAGANLLGEPVNVLFRRSALPEPVVDERWHYAVDLDLYFRCLGEQNAVVDSRTLCCFRVSSDQLSATLAASQARELRDLLHDLARRYPRNVSRSDLVLGSVRAQILAWARRVLYCQMRFRANRVKATREREAQSRSPSSSPKPVELGDGC